MKVIITLCLCLISSFCFSQDDVYGANNKPNSLLVFPKEFPLKEEKVVYEKVDTVSSLNKQQIYTASKKWIADTFKSGKAVIQSENETSGQIIGKGYGKVIFDDEGVIIKYIQVKFSIQVDAKEGRYRIRFYDLNTHQDAFGQYVRESDTPFEKNVGFMLNPKRPKQNEKNITLCVHP
ncbi:MAG: DUF4468 domain-containing protein, partial [Pedobacter sp.]